MKSGGFGIGKKQVRTEQPKRTVPPTTTDLVQLLASSQKQMDKLFIYDWYPPIEKETRYVLSVINSNAANQKDRRGWSSSAMDNNALGEAEWKLHKEKDNDKKELLSMFSSDAQLILTLMDEYLVSPGAGWSGAAAADQQDPYSSATSSSVFQQAIPEQQAPPPPAISNSGVMSGAKPKTIPPEGTLRRLPILQIAEIVAVGNVTGRLLVEAGNLQVEVFFMNGEPVHGKSCHAFYDDKDKTGDAVLVDLLTWKDGNFKFQDGWPAASKSIDKPLVQFLAGEVVIAEEASAPMAQSASAATSASSFAFAPAEPAAPPPPAPVMQNPYANPTAPPVIANALSNPAYAGVVAQAGTPAKLSEVKDDFSELDTLIAETYAGLVEPSGILKFGMFLMLARGEFVRQTQFCIASIELSINGSQLRSEFMPAIGEAFETCCQPLDILAHAGPSRLLVLFPHSNAGSAINTLKQFISNVQTTPLDSANHGSSVRVSAGLAEIPRDGTDLKDVLDFACKLRRAATPDRKIVSTSG
jgi:hypothetical protein